MTLYIRFVYISILCLFSVVIQAEVEVEERSTSEVEVLPPRSVEAQMYYEQIQAILLLDDFGEKETVTRWRLKELDDDDSEDEEDNDPKWLKWLSDWLNGLGDDESYEDDGSSDTTLNISKGLEIIIWLFFIGLGVYLLVKYRSQLHDFIKGLKATNKPKEALPATLFGLDVKKDSLPKDVVAMAQTAWRQGEQRQAIAVLLRASLIKLLHDHACHFTDSDTEAECCTRIDKQASATVATFMRALVVVWQQVAYAHKAPTEERFNELCQQWKQVF